MCGKRWGLTWLTRLSDNKDNPDKKKENNSLICYWTGHSPMKTGKKLIKMGNFINVRTLNEKEGEDVKDGN